MIVVNVPGQSLGRNPLQISWSRPYTLAIEFHVCSCVRLVMCSELSTVSILILVFTAMPLSLKTNYRL
jgi:hypothetical protein